MYRKNDFSHTRKANTKERLNNEEKSATTWWWLFTRDRSRHIAFPQENRVYTAGGQKISKLSTYPSPSWRSLLGYGTVDFCPTGFGRINCDLTTSSCDRHSATWWNTDIQSRATTISHLCTVREGRKRAWQQIWTHESKLSLSPLRTPFNQFPKILYVLGWLSWRLTCDY